LTTRRSAATMKPETDQPESPPSTSLEEGPSSRLKPTTRTTQHRSQVRAHISTATNRGHKEGLNTTLTKNITTVMGTPGIECPMFERSREPEECEGCAQQSDMGTRVCFLLIQQITRVLVIIQPCSTRAHTRAHHHSTRAHTHARTHARTHSFTHARTHAHTHARTHARTNAHTHIRAYIQ
jgi:hypothetical protein